MSPPMSQHQQSSNDSSSIHSSPGTKPFQPTVLMPEKKGSRRWAGKLFWILATLGLIVVVTLSLVVFFLYPRVPSFVEKEIVSKPVSVKAIDLSNASFDYSAYATYTFNNPNYAAIKLKSLDLSVYQVPQMNILGTTSELLVGSVHKGEVSIPMRTIQDVQFDVHLSGPLTDARGLIMDCNCKNNVILHFVGNAEVVYLGITANVPQDFQFTADCSVDVGFPIPCSL